MDGQSLRPAQPAASALRVVTCRLDREWYGVPADGVREVLRVGAVTPLPSVPAWIIGIMSNRGALLAVLDLRRRFGVSATAVTGASRIVVVSGSGNEVGLLVDEVGAVEDLAPGALELPMIGEGELSRYVAHVAHCQQRLLAILQLEPLLQEAPVQAA